MDPFSVASAAAGVISLGFTVCKGLTTYYVSYKDENRTVREMYESIESLEGMLKVLSQRIQSTACFSTAVVDRVNMSISSCEKGMRALEQKLEKIYTQPNTGTMKEKTSAFVKRTTYPFRESTLVKVKERCNELREELSLALAVLQIDISNGANEKLDDLGEATILISKQVADQGNNIARRLDKMISKDQDETSLRIHNWISPLAGRFEQRQKDTFHFSERQDGMAHWLVQTPEYRDWENSAGTVLWCTGMQGMGKTVLASFVINLLSTATKRNEIGIAYAYCSYKEQRDQSASNLVTGLLQQLLMQIDGLPQDVITLYEDHKKNRTRPLLEEFVQLFQSVTRRFTKKKIYLIIDGLDELPESHSTRRNFLHALRQVQDRACVLVTSRHIPSIEHQLSRATRLQLAANEEDIRNYLSQRILKWDLINRHSGKDPTLRQSIIDSILRKAQNMFLLARLYIESLLRLITLRKVKAALHMLPEGLNDMYHEVMQRIQTQEPGHAELAMAVLSWIYFAKRPLRVLEIQHALAIEPEDTFLDEDGLIETDVLVSVCCGLLSVTNEETITFIHYSTQEYFDSCASTLFKDAECRIAHTCITYLLFSELRRGPAQSDQALESLFESHPFLKYASTHWGHHLASRSELHDSVKGLTMDFLADSKAIASSVQVRAVCANPRRSRFPNYSTEFPAYTPGLVLASSFGLADICRDLIQEGCDIEVEDSRGVRALHEAIWNDQDSVVNLLLDSGADPTAEVNINSDYTPIEHSAAVLQGSSIHLMASKGQIHHLERLSKTQVNLHLRNAIGWNPMHKAAANGHIAVVRLLLLNGADVNSATTLNETALLLAADKGHVDLMDMLLKHHANPNLAGGMQETPLLRAAVGGHEAAVKLLLENGADWEMKDFHGWTPLYRALDMGHDTVVSMLRASGATTRLRSSGQSATPSSTSKQADRDIGGLLLPS